jgi:hypothetical protein
VAFIVLFPRQVLMYPADMYPADMYLHGDIYTGIRHLKFPFIELIIQQVFLIARVLLDSTRDVLLRFVVCCIVTALFVMCCLFDIGNSCNTPILGISA